MRKRTSESAHALLDEETIGNTPDVLRNMTVPSPEEWRKIVARAKNFVRKHKASDNPELAPGETLQIAKDLCSTIEFALVLATELRTDFYKTGGRDANATNRPLH